VVAVRRDDLGTPARAWADELGRDCLHAS
jgi:hypothetical protein